MVPRAKGTASRLFEEAEGYKARIVAQAEGDAQRFKLVQAEYAKAPQVTRERMYLDTMQQVYGNVSKVLVDTKQGSNMLYLPLDKVMQLSAQAEPTAAVAAPAPAAVSNGSPANAGAAASRSRESDRSRDRDVR